MQVDGDRGLGASHDAKQRRGSGPAGPSSRAPGARAMRPAAGARRQAPGGGRPGRGGMGGVAQTGRPVGRRPSGPRRAAAGPRQRALLKHSASKDPSPGRGGTPLWVGKAGGRRQARAGAGKNDAMDWGCGDEARTLARVRPCWAGNGRARVRTDKAGDRRQQGRQGARTGGRRAARRRCAAAVPVGVETCLGEAARRGPNHSGGPPSPGRAARRTQARQERTVSQRGGAAGVVRRPGATGRRPLPAALSSETGRGGSA
jgi:hypothetical protein